MNSLGTTVLLASFLMSAASSSSNGQNSPPVGMKVFYEVDRKKVPVGFKPTAEAMKQSVQFLNERLGNGRTGRVVKVERQRIEVDIFRAAPEKMDRIASFLTRLGTLELRILANLYDHKQLIHRAEHENSSRIENKEGKVLGWWVAVETGSRQNFVDSVNTNEIVSRTRGDERGKALEILVVDDKFGITEKHLTILRAGTCFGDGGRFPCVSLWFSERGARLLGGLTRQNTPDPAIGIYRRLGVILDGCLRAAPRIEGSFQDQMQLRTLNCTSQEAREIVWGLRHGPLPFPIRKVEERLVVNKPTGSKSRARVCLSEFFARERSNPTFKTDDHEKDPFLLRE